MKPLNEWDIVGMNHYYVNGEKFLFVTMQKDGRLIKEEGKDDEHLWNRLWRKSTEIGKANQVDAELCRSENDIENKAVLLAEDLYKQALELLGEQSQVDMVIEEIGELLSAMMKFRRGRIHIADLASEIADVEITIEQLKYIIGKEGIGMIEAFKDTKLKRLLERIDASKQTA